jgi:predicted Zn-dependent protease
MIDQLRRLAALILVFVVVVNAGTAAARGIPLIRDAEIEDTIRGYAEPLFRAAGLDPSAITVHIVRDPGLNAFVAGGQRLFIHTGLILAAERPNNLVGVIAHETGHISGGHLARTHQALQNAQVQTIIAMVLGAAAAVASGRGDAGGAIIAGGAGTAQRLFLSYSRTQEAAADHAGLSFLEATGQSASGLLDFFEILGDQDVLINNRSQDPYIRSHPLTRDRINTVRNHVAQSRFSSKEDPSETEAERLPRPTALDLAALSRDRHQHRGALRQSRRLSPSGAARRGAGRDRQSLGRAPHRSLL